MWVLGHSHHGYTNMGANMAGMSVSATPRFYVSPRKYIQPEMAQQSVALQPDMNTCIYGAVITKCASTDGLQPLTVQQQGGATRMVIPINWPLNVYQWTNRQCILLPWASGLCSPIQKNRRYINIFGFGMSIRWKGTGQAFVLSTSRS